MELDIELALKIGGALLTAGASWAWFAHKALQAAKDVRSLRPELEKSLARNRSDFKEDVQTLRREMANMLENIRDAIDAVHDRAEEANRKATRAHERVDDGNSATQKLEHSLIELRTQFRSWATTTQRLQPPPEGEP